MGVHERYETSSSRRPSLLERGGEIRDEAAALLTSVEGAGRQMRQEVGSRLREHPYRTLGYAAAAGFVLGGGIATSLTRFAFATGGRLLLALAVKRIAEGFEQALAARLENGSAGAAARPPGNAD